MEVSFDEPELTSDAGALLLREAARINGIIPAMAAAIGDGRRASHVDHSLAELLTQRIVQIWKAPPWPRRRSTRFACAC